MMYGGQIGVFLVMLHTFINRLLLSKKLLISLLGFLGTRIIQRVSNLGVSRIDNEQFRQRKSDSITPTILLSSVASQEFVGRM